ncbi:MAG: hypothetical protein KDE27_01980, partial [Planctomycetes bacterium]|nr:hypothetical protein [Planctomycetota bacterium]
EAVAAGGEAWLDSAPVIGWFVIATAGGAPAGIALTVDGRPAPDGTRVLAHARLPLLPAPPIVAEPIDRDDLASALGRPAIDAPLWLHVLLPTGLFAMLVPPGPVELTPAIRGELGFACDVLGPCRVHWFWRESAPEAGKPARCSAFGSCIAR